MDFLKKNRRFFLCYDGIPIDGIKYKKSEKEENGVYTAVYDLPNGLRITNTAKKYDRFGAYEWVNYLENISQKPSGIISDLWDCDAVIPAEHEEKQKWGAYYPPAETATKIYAPSGSNWAKDEMTVNIDEMRDNRRINHITVGETKVYSCEGGRSNNKQAPFFDVSKNSRGFIAAIGWTGQWKCMITREENEIRFRSKIEDTNFYLLPGEKIRTSSVVIMPYHDGRTAAHNRWRRLIKEEFSLLGRPGRDKYAPLSAAIWGGMQSREILERINTIKEHGLPYEYIWVDAGWYGEDTEPTPDEFEGDWYMHTGDWRVSKRIHPGGLADISRAAHEAGMKFLLWFEPERVRRGVPVYKSHPEYFLSNGENSDDLLLDLGNEEAWKYCFDMLCGMIEKIGIDFYRQDFNFSPLEYWQKNDLPDRKGMTEIKHINGLYRLWDSLLEKFPSLMIDNCASGGRRIDIEMLRRSVPLWRSDHQCPANCDIEAAQCHHLSYNFWMPYTGLGTGRGYDEYRLRSAYDSAIRVCDSFSAREDFCKNASETEFLKKYLNEYLMLRPYFSEDFYPLSEYSDKKDVWYAARFDRPSCGDGIIQVFRRDEAPYEQAVYNMEGTDKNCDYVFYDLDGGEEKISGKELAENGFKVTVGEKRKAKIFIYKKTEKEKDKNER